MQNSETSNPENIGLQATLEHIKNLDGKFDNHLFKQYPTGLDIILDTYYSVWRQVKYEETYEDKVIDYIKSGRIDFDHYCIQLLNILSLITFNDVGEIIPGLKNGYIIKRLISSDTYNCKVISLEYFDITFKIIKQEHLEKDSYTISFLSIKIQKQSYSFFNLILKFISSSKFFYFIIIALLIILFYKYNYILNIFELQSNNKLKIFIPSIDNSMPLVTYQSFRYISNVKLGLITLVMPLALFYLLWFAKCFIKFVNFVIQTQVRKKYNRQAEIYREYTPLNKFEYPLTDPCTDQIGDNILAANIYYRMIYENFIPDINKIIIIDAKRGMGKTTLINYLTQRINNITYRGTNYWKQFKEILFNQQISVVQLSVMPFLASLPENFDSNNSSQLKHEESSALNHMLQYIVDNVDASSAKIIKALMANIDSIEYKGVVFKNLKQLIPDNHKLKTLKDKMIKSEKKRLIIIEDLDRLSSYQFSIFAKFLWFIHELPFTITLIPCEKIELYKAINIKPHSELTYKELEQHKLFQTNFLLSPVVYKMLAKLALSYHLPSMDEKVTHKFNNNSYFSFYQTLKALTPHPVGLVQAFDKLIPELKENDWEVKLLHNLQNSYQYLNKLAQDLNSENKLTYYNLQNATQKNNWTKFLVTSMGIEENADPSTIIATLDNPYIILCQTGFALSSLTNKGFKNAVIDDIKLILEKYQVSIREFKAIIGDLNLSSKPFIVKQMVSNILKYRYGNQRYVIEYLQNHTTNITETFIKNSLSNITNSEILKIIHDIEEYPCLNNTHGITNIKAFILGIWRINLSSEGSQEQITSLFCRTFIKTQSRPDKTFLQTYNALSTDWVNMEDTAYLYSIRSFLSNSLIIMFNQLAIKGIEGSKQESVTKQSNGIVHNNLFFLQNMAISFLNVIHYKTAHPEYNFLEFELKPRLNDTEIEIRDTLADENIFIPLNPILIYFKKLFNICTNTFEFDKTNQTFSNNIVHLRKLLIHDTADPKFIKIFDQISN